MCKGQINNLAQNIEPDSVKKKVRTQCYFSVIIIELNKDANRCTTYWDVQQPYWLLLGIVRHNVVALIQGLSSEIHLFNPGKTLQQGQSASQEPAIFYFFICDVGIKEFFQRWPPPNLISLYGPTASASKIQTLICFKLNIWIYR